MKWFSRSLIIGAATAALSFSGCTQPTAGKSVSSGSLALSSDDALLYAVDTDNGIVSVIDTKTDTKITDVKVGKSPVRVVVGSDDTIYVTNRGDRTVSVIRRGEWTEASKIATNVEPNGLAISPDARTLYVVSATSSDDPDVGTLTAVDTTTMQPKWETRVGNEPRAIGLLSGNRAMVTQYKTGQIVEVDLNTGKINNEPNNEAIYTAANKSKLDGSNSSLGGSFASFRPRALNDVAVTPDGNRAFVPTVWAREDAIGKRPSAAGGYYAAGGPCNIGSVATAGIVTVDTKNSPSPQTDDLTDCASRGLNTANADFPPSTLAPGTGAASLPQQGPTVAVVDSTGDWLYVVNKESSNVAVMPTSRRDSANGEAIDFNTTGSSLRSTTKVADGTDGIALTKDGLTAYTYSQFDHSVQKVYAGDPKTGERARGPESQLITSTIKLVVASDTLTQAQADGRRLFFDAHDTNLSSDKTTVACSTCHLEGRDDAHVWVFPDGKRQTPSLVGRGLSQTAPFHWSGEFATISAFMSHTVKERMGGTGLSDPQISNMVSWLDQEQLPENSAHLASLTAEQSRGQAVFQKAQCGSCHSGEFMTNNSFANVGTQLVSDEIDINKGFNVPSLRGVARSAPYLHDGSAPTLRARLDQKDDDKHGVTSTLTSDEKNDLVAYLKTL